MSRLEELIQEYCPDGVEYKRLESVAEIGTGSRNTQDAIENGKYVFFVRSQTPLQLNEYDYDDESVITAGDGVGVGKVFHITHGKYALHQRAYRIHPMEKSLLNVKYLYYVFTNNFYDYIMMQKYTGSVASVRLPMLKAFEIPVPPLPVQQEIVRILDSFTELTAELKAELKARKKQYEYYRDELIHKYCGNDVKCLSLNKFSKIYDGTHNTPHYTSSGIKFVSVENINDLYNTKKYISEEAYEKYKIKPQIGDILMTRIGSIGKCTVIEKNESLAYYVSLALIRPNSSMVTSRYLKYIIESLVGRKELRKRTLVTAVPIKINKDDIGKIILPVPPLSVQNEIVSILDRFDTLCNDISSGLPAEIEARQKQYEYYRDKLLSFKEKQN